MKADELDFPLTEEHIFHSLGFSHPLVQLMPYEPNAPAPLVMVRDQLWAEASDSRGH